MPFPIHDLCLARSLVQKWKRAYRTALVGAHIIAICLWGSPFPSFATNLKIVAKGHSDYIIAVPTMPTPAEQLAAEELSRYLEQMSGAHIGIRHGSKLIRKAIVVSEWSHLVGLAVGCPPSYLKVRVTGDAYAIVADGPRLFLVGGRGRSTLYAVYAFLERLGCRWLAPNFSSYKGAAEVVPHARTLYYPEDQKILAKPAFALRKIYVEEGHSHNSQNLAELIVWMSKVGYNTLAVPMDYEGEGKVRWDEWRGALIPEVQRRDVLLEVGGHGYQNFLNANMNGGKLFATHPEWFGQDKWHRRRREPRYVFCTSNREAVEVFIDNFVEYARTHPEVQIFDLWPPDETRWCECSQCRKLGSPANRQAILVDRVQGALANVRPRARLECLAYGTWLHPPESAKLDKDVLLDFCPIDQSFEFQIGDLSSPNMKYAEALRAWRHCFDGEISIYSYYRKYAWNSLPMVIPRYMQRDLQFYQHLAVGISTYAEPGDWITYELNHYTLAKLAWDPSVNVQGLIMDFCQARYRAKALEAIQALETLEEVVPRMCSIPYTTLKSPAQLSGAEAQLQKVDKNLEKALESCGDPLVRRNLSSLSLMVQYALADLRIQKARACNATDDAIIQKLRELREFLFQHEREGLFLTEDPRLSLPGLVAHYLPRSREVCVLRCLEFPFSLIPSCALSCIAP